MDWEKKIFKFKYLFEIRLHPHLEQRKSGVKTIPNPADESHAKLVN